VAGNLEHTAALYHGYYHNGGVLPMGDE
jgi:hypothetical protein